MQLSIEIREDCDEVQFGIYVKTCQCGDTVKKQWTVRLRN